MSANKRKGLLTVCLKKAKPYIPPDLEFSILAQYRQNRTNGTPNYEAGVNSLRSHLDAVRALIKAEQEIAVPKAAEQDQAPPEPQSSRPSFGLEIDSPEAMRQREQDAKDAQAEIAAKNRAAAAIAGGQKRKLNNAEEKARADAIRKERADAAVANFALGDKPPESKVSTDEAAGQKDVFGAVEDAAPAPPNTLANRFEVGNALTKEQRKSVLATLVDVYKAKDAPRESKGQGRDGNERSGYAYSPELFEKSDITGAMVRYYVTLPDGRMAHPSELFPDYTQNDINNEIERRANAEKRNRQIARETYLAETFDTKREASAFWNERSDKSNKTAQGNPTVSDAFDREFITDGKKFAMIPAPVLKNRDMMDAIKAEGWEKVKSPTDSVAEAKADKGKESGQGGMFARGAQTAPQFYSQLKRAIDQVPERLASMPAQQWKLWLDSNGPKLGVKKDEIEWSGIKDYLDLRNKDKVTRDELAAYLADSGVRVTETVLGGAFGSAERIELERLSDIPRRDRTQAESTRLSELQNVANQEDSVGRGTKYAEYTQPGGENYREVLITLPVKQNQRWAVLDKNGRGHSNFDNEIEAQAEADDIGGTIKAYTPAGIPDSKNYKSSHWDQPNVVVHIRVNDRIDANGKRVFFVEEIQSDWGQDGKKKGFKGKTQEDAKQFFGISDADWAKTSAEDREAYRDEMVNTSGRGVIPAGPFVTKTESWLNLALKRVMMMAVEGGYDKVAFTDAEPHFKRWGTERIDWAKQPDGSYLVRAKSQEGGDAAGIDLEAEALARGMSKTNSKIVWTVEELEKTIEPALTEGQNAADLAPKIWSRMQSEDVGTAMPRREGFEAFYGDKNGMNPKTGQPSFLLLSMNALLKKLGGGKMESVKIPTDDLRMGELEKLAASGRLDDSGNLVQPGITITDAMRKTVGQGLPLFARDRPAEAPTTPANRLQMPVSDVQKAIDQIAAKWTNGPKTVVVNMPSDLPRPAPSDARGLLYGDTAYIVASNHTNRAGVQRTLAHEAIGHYGLWKMLGPDGTRKFQKNLQLALKSGNKPLNELSQNVRKLYVDKNGKFNLSPEDEANEIAAFAVEAALDADGNFKPGFGFMKEVYAKIAQFLRDLGINIQFTNSELQGMLVAATRGMEAGKRLDGGQGVVNAYARAWHGTPHRFDKFTTDKMGTGEGAQAYGWGLYFASKKEIAEHYRKNLQTTTRGGLFYKGNPLTVSTMNKLALNGSPSEQSVFSAKWPSKNIETEMEKRALQYEADAVEKAKQNSAISKEWAAEYTRRAAAIRSVMADTERRADRENGQLYEVEIPEDSEMLLWDKPMSEQPEAVLRNFKNLSQKLSSRFTVYKSASSLRYELETSDGLVDTEAGSFATEAEAERAIKDPTGERLYKLIERDTGSDKAASLALLGRGIKGIKYLDGTSRSAGEGSYNYVIFSGDDVEIQKAYYARGKFKGWPKSSNWTRQEYNDVVSLLPSAYRNDPHRREPLPANYRDSLPAGALQELASYGSIFSLDDLGNIQVDGQTAIKEDYANAKAMADKYGLGVFATNVKRAAMQQLHDDGFVGEMGMAMVLMRETGSSRAPMATPSENRYTKDAYSFGTMMAYKPRGFSPPTMFARGADDAMANQGGIAAGDGAPDADKSVRLPTKERPIISGTSASGPAGLSVYLSEINSEEMKMRAGRETLQKKINGLEITKSQFGGGRIIKRNSSGEIIGALQFVTSPKEAILSNIFVRRDFRRKGVASELVEQLKRDYKNAFVDSSLTEDGAKFFGYFNGELVGPTAPDNGGAFARGGSTGAATDQTIGKSTGVYIDGDKELSMQSREVKNALLEGFTANDDSFLSKWFIQKMIDDDVMGHELFSIMTNSSDSDIYGDNEDREGAKNALFAIGIDGITFQDEKTIEFLPKNIRPRKSNPTASNNGGAFARGGNLFAPTVWNTPDSTRTDKIIYELQDGRIDLKRVQQAIEKSGQKIEEKWDARLAETLYPGRVAHRSKQFLKAEVQPLLKALATYQVPMNELADYLHARGAQERNAQVAKVNGMPDGGAGKNTKGVLMTNQAAKDYLAAVTPARKRVLDVLAKKVDAITAGTRDLLVTEGLEKQSTIDAWTATYKNYVPMFRDEAESGTPHPQGSGFSVKGSASKRVTGSTKEVTNILAHVLMQREAAITRAEKNHVALSLYGMALSHPNPQFWTTIRPNMTAAKIGTELQSMGVDPATAIVGMERAPTITTIDADTGKKVDRLNPMYKSLPGAMPLRINGEDRVLMINVGNERGARMAENLKNLDGLTKLDLANTIVGKSTRWLASVWTQYNPVFGLVNLTRDTLGAAVNLGSTGLRGNALKVLVKTPLAIVGIARELASGNQTGKWQTLYRQFQEDGGQTGFKDNFRDAGDRAKAIEAELKALGRAKLDPRRGANMMLELLDGFNTTLENAVRLSAYSAALDKGMSRAESARLGRELTVDFNRKGRMGREAGPLYAFFNASVQGSARTIQTLAGPTGAKVIAGGLGLGVLQALMLAAAGYDDDELPEWVKTRALIIPMFDAEKSYVAIPYPLGLHVIPNTGRVMAELALNGGKDIGKRTVGAIGELAGAFNPLGGGNIFTADGALKTIAPTVVDPIIEMGFNKNFAGGTIEKQNYGGESDNRPGAARAKEGTLRSTTGQAYLGISKAINSLTGGTDYEAGKLSPTPERLRYIAQTVGGGLLREIENSINASTAEQYGKEVAPNKIPVLGRFYGEVDAEQNIQRRYYETANDLRKMEGSLKAMKKAGDFEAADAFKAENPELKLIRKYHRLQSSITKLNKEAVQVVNDPTEAAAIDQKRLELMGKLNDALKELEQETEKPNMGDKIKEATKGWRRE